MLSLLDLFGRQRRDIVTLELTTHARRLLLSLLYLIWLKNRIQYPLITLVFFLFVFFSILYNAEDPFFNGVTFSSKKEPLLKSSHKENLTISGNPPVPLDKSSTCHSTVKYSGRRAKWGSRVLGSGGRRELLETCDYTSGKWDFDNISHPLYNESDCPYMSDQVACQKYGRSDLDYQYWRWQPHNCNLKRWNSTELWEKLRGKRLMFVGDSLNRGQWLSMVCLMQSVIPVEKQFMTQQAHLTSFRAEEYNASIEFLWAPFLVESNSDEPMGHRLPEKILRPDSNLRHSSHWIHADILVFNSYLWWRKGSVKLLWSTEENGVCEEIDGLRGMELAMDAWANWVESNVDPMKKKVFFVTMSPTHLLKQEWEPGKRGNCYGEKLLIKNQTRETNVDMPTTLMVEKVLARLSSKVSVLNITRLTAYRKDGHPSIYRKFYGILSPEELANPASYSDCIHWCLPGVSDVWNELLFQFF